MAGYNFIENSSSKNISGTSISKRGRKNLRNVLYQMARFLVKRRDEKVESILKNEGSKSFKEKASTRSNFKKIVIVIYNIMRKQTTYKAELVLGEFRRNQMQQAA